MSWNRIIKIALVEPNLSGHHVVYLEHFIQCLRQKGYNVTVYSLRSMGDTSFKIIPYIKGWRLPKNSIIKKFVVGINWGILSVNWLFLRKQLSKGTDLVFFCCLDDYMNELMPKWLFEILFPYNFSGLLLTPRQETKMFFFDRRNILKSRYCKSVAVLDEFCRDYLIPYQSNIVYFPDFSDESKPNTNYDLALKVLEKARGRKIISLLGAIDLRKGIVNFIEASKLADQTKYFFLIAGKSFLTGREQEILDNFVNRSNCLYWGQRIPTEADFNQLVAISDVIYAAYVNFTQSSNMFSKCALFGKPLIVSRGYYMEEVVNRYHLGCVISQDSPSECVKAIFDCLDHPIDQDKWKRYLDHHSVRQLDRAFSEILK